MTAPRRGEPPWAGVPVRRQGAPDPRRQGARPAPTARRATPAGRQAPAPAPRPAAGRAAPTARSGAPVARTGAPKPGQSKPGQPGRPTQGQAKQGQAKQGRPTTARLRQSPVDRQPGRGRPAPRVPRAVPPRRPPRQRRPRRPRRPADPGRRLRLALIVMLFALTVFGGRLVQLQGLDGPTTASRALAERTTTVPLTAHRGDIVDADGNVLATTVDRVNLLVDQTIVANYKRSGVLVGAQGAAVDVGRVLNVSAASLLPKLTGTNKGALLAKDLPPDVAREVLRLPIPGILPQSASRRTYPAKTTAANVLGFVSTAEDGRALGGIELARDADLKGRSGWLRYEHARDAARTRIPTGVTEEQEPQPGRTVQLTLVRDLQWRAQDLIDAQVAATGSASGDVVVLDAKTFQVLALATAPTFDPNAYGKASADDLGNRPLLDVFEPGSTAKVITMAAALQEKVVTPTTPITVPPSLHRGGRTFTDAETHGTEQLTVNGVLAQSSNIGTIEVGERVAPATLYDYMRRFGLGSKTGVGLPESAGLLVPGDTWTDSQRYTVMFGQGMSVTALQAASVFATIANNGVRLQPQLVAGERDADGVLHPEPTPAGVQVISPEVAKSMREMLENVVGKNGTAEKANVAGYRVAGKTGTAQVADRGVYRDGWYTASFIGMAPADDPALVIAVILQKPTNGHFGGEVAAPVFQELMTAALLQRKVPPTGTKPPDIPIRWR